MKLIHFTLLALFALLVAAKCDKPEKSGFLIQKWEFVESMDPYQGGTIIQADSLNKQ
jgi:hypothetical protein